ncbi:TPA: glycosyltransferase family 2 protein [Streptococcus suis]|nr:glycosyltransferase family 2 protein [Streptococcus suis]
MSKYLLSVVIPTRNRHYYAEKSIRQVYSQLSEDCQVVIQDNSDSSVLKEMISDLLSFDNITYNHTAESLSFVANFDQALSLVQGKYVCMIGDDDGITSFLREVAIWANENDIQAIRPTLDLVYFWPNSKVFSANQDTGILQINTSTSKIYDKKPGKALRNLLKDGCLDYLQKEMVKIYHGLISYEILLEIKKRTGNFVGGLSPDIYLSVALTILSKGRCVAIDFPITISGICVSSGSSSSATGAHTGKLEQAPHFKGHNHYVWDRRVPEFYSVETIWADSALAAVKDLDSERLVYFDGIPLYYSLMRKYPDFNREIQEAITKNISNNVNFKAYKIKLFVNRIRKSIVYRLGRRKQLQFKDVSNIDEASNLIEKNMAGVYREFKERYAGK